MPTSRAQILQTLGELLGEIAPNYVKGTIVPNETEPPFILFEVDVEDFERGSKDNIQSRVSPSIVVVGENLLQREELLAEVLEALPLTPVRAQSQNSYEGRFPLYGVQVDFQSVYLEYPLVGGVVSAFVTALNELRGQLTLTGAGSVIVTTDPSGVITISGSATGGGVGDHGELTGLADDDHPQYSLVDGTRAFTGSITATSGTFTQGLTVGSATTYVYPNEVRSPVGTFGAATVNGQAVAPRPELLSVSGSLQSAIDEIELTPGPQGPQGIQGPAGPVSAIVGSNGNAVVSGSNTIEVQGFYTEFVAASGTLRTGITSASNAANFAILSVDNHTGDSAAHSSLFNAKANTSTLVAVSGHLQNQLNSLDSTYATDSHLVSVSGHLQTDLDDNVAFLQDQINSKANATHSHTAMNVGTSGLTLTHNTNTPLIFHRNSSQEMAILFRFSNTLNLELQKIGTTAAGDFYISGLGGSAATAWFKGATNTPSDSLVTNMYGVGIKRTPTDPEDTGTGSALEVEGTVHAHSPTTSGHLTTKSYVDATLTSVSGHLQSQLNSLDSTYATDAQVATISGHLQTQIDEIEPEIPDTIPAPFKILATSPGPVGAILRLYLDEIAGAAAPAGISFGGEHFLPDLYFFGIDADLGFTLDTPDGSVFRMTIGVPVDSIVATHVGVGIHKAEPEYALDVGGDARIDQTLLAASGTFTEGITVGTSTTYLYPDEIRSPLGSFTALTKNGQAVATESYVDNAVGEGGGGGVSEAQLLSVSGSLQTQILEVDPFSGYSAPNVTYKIWTPSDIPGNFAGSESASVLGVRFQSLVAGHVVGVRFYKHASNTGTHVGRLWTNAGSLLATKNFSGETSSGWQEVLFDTPVAINASTDYIVSYSCPNGFYAQTENYFTTPKVSAPLIASAGFWQAGASTTFPTDGFPHENPWVDVVFAVSGTRHVFPGRVEAQGIVPGAMTNSAKDALISPPVGMLIYNTTSGTYNGWTGTSWRTLSFT